MLLTRLAVHRPVTTIMVCVIIATLGVASLSRLPIDLMPDIKNLSLVVRGTYPGAGPSQIESLITRPLEQAFGSVNDVTEISSSSGEGRTYFRITFHWGTDLDKARSALREAISTTQDLLPEEMDNLTIGAYDPAESPVMMLAVMSDLEPAAMTSFVESRVVPRLERVAGVSRIRVGGKVSREIQVDLNRDDLQARNISFQDVIDALRRENAIRRAGDVKQGHIHLLVRTQGSFKDVDDIADTIVRKSGEAVVRVRDIGQVTDISQRKGQGTLINGTPSMLVWIHKNAGENTVEVCDGLVLAVQEFNEHSTGTKLVIRNNTGQFIRLAINNVRSTLWYGVVLAGIVLLVFLGSLRSTCIIAVSMPLSILGTLVLMHLSGFTLNVVSFGGLALGIGLLVDNSIVVLESIFRRRGEGLSPKLAAIEGTSEVSSAILASTITTLIVFVPAVFIEGRTGVVLQQLAWVVSISLSCSLFVSLTLTPMLTTFSQHVSGTKEISKSQGLIDQFQRANSGVRGRIEIAYQRLLQFTLRHAGIISVLLLGSLACTLAMTPLIGTELMPKTESRILSVSGSMAPTIQQDKLQDASRTIEQTIEQHVPESKVIFTWMGDTSISSKNWNRVYTETDLGPSVDRDRSSEEIRRDVEAKLPQIPGMKARVNIRNDSPGLGGLGRLGGTGVIVEVLGPNLDVSEELATRVGAAMKKTAGLINIQVAKQPRQAIMAATIGRRRAGSLGVRVEDIAMTVETAIRGARPVVYHDDDNEIDVVVRLRETDRDQVMDIGEVGVVASTGQVIPLKSIVTFVNRKDPTTIRRMNQQRMIAVNAEIEGRDLGSTVFDLKKQLGNVTIPDGYAVGITGEWREQQKSFQALRLGLIMAIALMYMVMASQFESLRDPLVVIMTIPLGTIGVVLALVLTNTTLNVQSFIGIVLLSGIVVNNAIVLVDYMNQLRRADESVSIDTIVIHAATRRFRPIMMTTITTVLAMVPIAIGFGEGSELQAPMARVLIGGLSAATLTTLIAIPIAYRLLRAR